MTKMTLFDSCTSFDVGTKGAFSVYCIASFNGDQICIHEMGDWPPTGNQRGGILASPVIFPCVIARLNKPK